MNNNQDICHGCEVKELNYYFNRDNNTVSFEDVVRKIIQLNDSGLDFRVDIIIGEKYGEDVYLQTK